MEQLLTRFQSDHKLSVAGVRIVQSSKALLVETFLDLTEKVLHKSRSVVLTAGHWTPVLSETSERVGRVSWAFEEVGRPTCTFVAFSSHLDVFLSYGAW